MKHIAAVLFLALAASPFATVAAKLVRVFILAETGMGGPEETRPRALSLRNARRTLSSGKYSLPSSCTVSADSASTAPFHTARIISIALPVDAQW